MITFRHLLNAVFSLYKPLHISFGDLNPFTATNELISGFLSGPDMPAAPDYTGAAEATAEGNLENARYATVANRPDQTTPWGTSTWSQDPDNPDKWSQNVTLSPEQQRLYETNTQTSQRMGDIGLMGLNSAADLFSSRYQTPTDMPQYQGATAQVDPYANPAGDIPGYNTPGTYGDKRQQVIDSMMSRSNTDIARQRDNKRSELIAQGIPPNSEAFDREMERFDRMNVDARQQAEIAAAGMATQEYGAELAGEQQRFTAEMQRRGMSSQEAQNLWNSQMATREQQTREGTTQYTMDADRAKQLIQNAMLERQTPLNELNALRTGTQVSMPQFSAVPQQQAVPGPDYMGAAGAQSQYDLAGYNADVARQNAMIGGLFGLGGAYLGSK